MSERSDLARGFVAGVGAGIIASVVMNEFQALWMVMAKPSSGKDARPATLNVADRISQTVAGEPVPKAAQEPASNAVHLATGAALGGFYGVVAEFAPIISKGCGGAYSAVVWAALDNGVVPALKLSAPPARTEPKDHLYAFLSHLVFGASLEISRRVLAIIL